MTIAAILAAGSASRFGAVKQLALFESDPLVVRACQAALKAGLECVVIVGAHAREVRAAVAGLEVLCLENQQWREGLSSSIRRATHHALETGAGELAILLADQPLITADHLGALRRRRIADQTTIAATRYADTTGVPAIFASSLFDELLTLEGDRGAGGLIRRTPHSSVVFEDAAFDVDSPRDIEQRLRRPKPGCSPSAKRE